MELQNPQEYGLVYGSKNKVMAWHVDLKEPEVLAERDKSDAYRNHITSLTFNDGKLYDAGYDGVVRETLGNKIIGEFSLTSHKSPIFGIDSIKGRLIALRHIETAEGIYDEARLHYVDNGEDIVNNFHTDCKNGLAYRAHSLDLKVTNRGKIYVASENIVEVFPRKNSKSRIKKLTEYLSDFVTLASDGNKVYSLHTHNSGTNPDGTEVRDVPSNKRTAFWIPSDDWGDKENQKSYGFSRMFALHKNTLIVGMKDYKNKECNFCAVILTPKMMRLKNGAKATPLTLIKNGYERPDVYGEGNPLLVLSKKDLKKVFYDAQVEKFSTIETRV